MRREALSVYVDGEIAHAIREQARMAGMSHSAFVERLLAQHVAGGDKRSRRNLAFLASGVDELLRHAGKEARDRAHDQYRKLVARENLGEDEPSEDLRRAQRA